MKNKNLLFAFSFLIFQLNAQVSWQKMADLPGSGRDHSIAFSYGTKGYVISGENGSTLYKDFWEYNSNTNVWAQLPNYPGVARSYGIGYTIGTKAYIGFGHNTAGTFLTDWWEYDFNTSIWTQKNNFPGVGRDHPCCAVMNGKLYMGFGDNSSGSIKDWWQYDPNLDSWVAKANYPGLKMHHPVTAQDANLIYLSEGHIINGGTNYGSVDFYSYNATNNTWATLAIMPGPGVVAGASFYLGNNIVYSGAGITEPAGAFHQEFYAYDIIGGTWSPITNYPGLGVFGPVSFVIGNAGYVVTGQNSSSVCVKDLYKLSVLLALDAGVSSVTTPNGTLCNTTFSPVVTIQNFGATTLTSCTINYQIDANPNQTFAWSGSLAIGASTNVTLPSVTVTAGTHTFTTSTTGPNGGSDGNTANDQTQSVFSTSAVALPLMEGFESSASLPSGWTLYNPDADAAWQVSTTVAKTGTNSIGFNNCNGDGNTDMTGRKDRFITKVYDFSSASSAQMSFDVAYSPLFYQSVFYGDSLAVYSSINCGTSWSRIYYKGGLTLATTAQQTSVASCWTPTSAQWRNDIINLSGLIGQPSVMFAFEDISMWGEWIYIDNINISSTTGITSTNLFEGFTIYPNPSSSSFTFEGNSDSEKIHYTLLNVIGKEVLAGDIILTGTNFSGKIQVGEFAKGMYFLKVSDGKNSATKKVMVE